MIENAEQEKLHGLLLNLQASLQGGAMPEVRRMLAEMHPAEIAILLESLPYEERLSVWEQVESGLRGEVLIHCAEDVRAGLIRQMSAEELVAATEGLDPDDLADFLPEMPEGVIRQVLSHMDAQNRARLEGLMAYPEDTAGGLMNVDTITVRADISLDVVLRYLRWIGKIPETTDSLMVVNRNNRYLGLLPITNLLTRDPDLTVAEVMIRDIEGIPAETPAIEVANLFERRDLVSAPVIDASGQLLGRITIDDVVDVIREEADHSILGRAGLDEDEDIFAPVLQSSRRRAVWLGVNLFTAFAAAWVISLFDATIEKLVALAVLMPVVASMGGIAGSQTLTLVIRGMALGRIGSGNARRVLIKELAVGVMNGLLWAVVIASVAYFWFGSESLGAVIAAAIVVNLIAAALAGAIIPFILRRLSIDPALAGSVVLIAVTDVIGFFTFLGLAALFLV